VLTVDLHGTRFAGRRSQRTVLRHDFVETFNSGQPGWLLCRVISSHQGWSLDGIRCVILAQPACRWSAKYGICRGMPGSPPHFSLGGAEGALIPRCRVVCTGWACKDTGGIRVWRAGGRAIWWRICTTMLCEERVAASWHGQSASGGLALPEAMCCGWHGRGILGAGRWATSVDIGWSIRRPASRGARNPTNLAWRRTRRLSHRIQSQACPAGGVVGHDQWRGSSAKLWGLAKGGRRRCDTGG
jgi:hypothetical protein